jgi:hypothetical protein
MLVMLATILNPLFAIAVVTHAHDGLDLHEHVTDVCQLSDDLAWHIADDHQHDLVIDVSSPIEVDVVVESPGKISSAAARSQSGHISHSHMRLPLALQDVVNPIAAPSVRGCDFVNNPGPARSHVMGILRSNHSLLF